MLFFYFSLEKTAFVALNRVVSVTCEKCGCAYYYELTRIGAGSTEAAYGILTLSGSSAEQQAEKEAWGWVTNDAELVPCPQCKWINEDLVICHRKGRTERWRILASLVVYAGLGLTLFIALVGYFSARRPLELIAYIIGPGILGTFSIAATFKAIRKWLEHSIQPNRNHPEEPHLPIGTPPALVMNDQRQLVPARPGALDTQREGEHKSMAFQVGRHAVIGHTCCVCMGEANHMSSFTIQPIAGFDFQMGLCWGCGCRNTVASCAKSFGAALVVFAVTTSLAILAGIREEGIVFVNLLLSVAVGWIVWSLVRYPIRVTVVDVTRGVLFLKFKNPQFPSLVYHYDRHLIEANETNVPDFSFLEQDPNDQITNENEKARD